MNPKDFKLISDFQAELTAGNVKAAMANAGAKSSDLWTKAAGKGKASAKHTEGSLTLSRHKKHGPALFEIIGRLLDTKPNIPEPFSTELDELFAKAGG